MVKKQKQGNQLQGYCSNQENKMAPQPSAELERTSEIYWVYILVIGHTGPANGLCIGRYYKECDK